MIIRARCRLSEIVMIVIMDMGVWGGGGHYEALVGGKKKKVKSSYSTGMQGHKM